MSESIAKKQGILIGRRVAYIWLTRRSSRDFPQWRIKYRLTHGAEEKGGGQSCELSIGDATTKQKFPGSPATLRYLGSLEAALDLNCSCR